MYKVTRTEVRPELVSFHYYRNPHVRELMAQLGITREEVISPDTLTRTVTMIAPDKKIMDDFVYDPVVLVNLIEARENYNDLNGITYTLVIEQ